MSFGTLYGAPVPRRGAPPTLPVYGFLAAADEVIDPDPSWSSGIEVEGLDTTTPTLALAGVAESTWDGSISSRPITLKFPSFVVRRRVREGSDVDFDTVVGYAKDGFTVWETVDVGREVWTGARGSRHLAETVADVLPAEPTVTDGVAALIAALGLWPGQIHMTTAALARYLESSQNGWTMTGGKFYTALGRHLLIADDGYPGTSKTGAAPAAGHTWMFGVDPIRYRRGPVEVLGGSEGSMLDRDQNNIEILIQRYYLLDGRFERHVCIDVTL